MERQRRFPETVMRIADFGPPVLLLATALFSNSLILVGLSIAGLTLAAREALVIALPWRLGRSPSHRFQYGFGKAVQAGNLLVGLCALSAGFWLADQAFELIVSGSIEISPQGFALAATANALVVTWHGVVAYAHVVAFDLARRVLLRGRRGFFALLATVQLFLTVAVLGKDAEIAHWVDTLGAVIVSLIVVGASLKLAWDSVCDLIDHPLDKDQEAAITTLIHREGVQADDLVDLRTRRCGQQVFAEVTLRMLESTPIEEARRRLAGLRRALEVAVTDLDLVIKLQGAKP